MINPANETFGQARQGSVAAIIQVLNEQLANNGIRTRAVVADGMLQILCEAAEAKQLDKSTVVDRVRSVLETISPNRIRKVKINSRIVKEEQLLWLEEINRDPENALLWSEIITLKQPLFFQRWIRDRHLRADEPLIKDITEPTSTSLSTKIISGVGLLALLLGAIWLFREDLGIGGPATTVAEQPASSQTETGDGLAIEEANSNSADRTANTTPSNPPGSSASNPPTATTNRPPGDNTPVPGSTENPAEQTNQPPTPDNFGNGGNSGSAEDAFAEAVRIAGRAAEEGLTASTRAEWLALAARWQRASELMGEIPKGSNRYEVAADRVETYKANSQTALQKAEAVAP